MVGALGRLLRVERCMTHTGVIWFPDCHSSCDVHVQVVGAVGRLLRVERCERLQLVAATTRICIATCHDCVFYLGVNRPPLLIGDNRFLQVCPATTWPAGVIMYNRLLAFPGSCISPRM